MRKTVLRVPEELADRIRREAQVEGVSVAEVLEAWARVSEDARMLEASGSGDAWEAVGPARGH